MKGKSVGVGLIGFGVIGNAVAQILQDKAELLTEAVGVPVVLRRIKVVEADLSRPQAKLFAPALFTTDDETFFGDPDIDIVVEAIGGDGVALKYLRRALGDGKHGVTPNKELVAKHGAELIALAKKQGVALRYEASTGGGIPLIDSIQHGLVVNEIKRIYAIINGTTNYILTRMEKDGLSFAEALAKAQELGFAEPDPTNDIEGVDSCYKLAIMASIVFKHHVRPQEIYREGITRLDGRDFRYAREMGYAIKLLAIGKQQNGEIEVRVHPVLMPADSLLAKVDGVYNAVLVDGDLVGKVLLYGQGAGPWPTGSAVVADVISAARDIVSGSASRAVERRATAKKVKPMAEVVTRYYFRISAADRPGVLAQVSRVLGDNNISISSVIQKDLDEVTQSAELMIMTHPAQEAAVGRSLEEMEKMDVVKEISNFIRVEEI